MIPIFRAKGIYKNIEGKYKIGYYQYPKWGSLQNNCYKEKTDWYNFKPYPITISYKDSTADLSIKNVGFSHKTNEAEIYFLEYNGNCNNADLNINHFHNNKKIHSQIK